MKRRYLLFILIVFFFIACKQEYTKIDDKNSKERELIPEPDANPELSDAQVDAALIAKANGFAEWKNVSRLHYTFNVDRGDSHFERSWTWKPTEDHITMRSREDTISYKRSFIDSTSLAVDKGFINDKFWLLAPFNLVWDEGTSFIKEENAEAPISKEKLNKLTLVYGSKGGYTPGDAYDFFYDQDFMIREWIFRKDNAAAPSLVNTWEDYENFNGIKISKMRKNEDGSFKLYFTNIKIEKN